MPTHGKSPDSGGRRWFVRWRSTTTPPTGSLYRPRNELRWRGRLRATPGRSQGKAMLNDDCKGMLSDLNAAGVDNLVVGAFAVAAHRLPRATGDMDLRVRPTPENATRAMQALRTFGAPPPQVTEVDFASSDVVFQIGGAPRRIDIMTRTRGVAFWDAWVARMQVETGDLVVPVIGLEHLSTYKRVVGRHKDRSDAAALARMVNRDG